MGLGSTVVGVRTVYTRSTLGARIRSPLGSFRGNAVQFMEIITWPRFIADGSSVTITGELFGATQGTGSVRICNRNDCSILAQTQTIVSWADTSITFTADLDAGALEGMLVYINLTTDTGATDAVAATTEEISGEVSIEELVPGGGTYTLQVDLCGADPLATYCVMRVLSGPVDIFDGVRQYGYEIEFGKFFNECPAFYLMGQTSNKTLEFGYRDHWTESGTTYADPGTAVFCSVDGGHVAVFRRVDGGAFGEDPMVAILYEEASCGVDTYGWTAGENAVLVPKYPVSISIADGINFQTFKPSVSVSFVASSFAGEGNISASVKWYQLTTLLYTGATYAFTTSATEADKNIALITTNANFQSRTFVDILQDANDAIEYVGDVNYYVRNMAITDVFPPNGSTAGGQKMWIFGTSFESGCSVEFGGVAATSAVLINTYWIECVLPAGTGVVDVEVIDTNGTITSVGAFEYATAATMTATAASPTSANIAGGDVITITGTGFTANCEVFFEFRFLAYKGKSIGVGPVVTFEYPAAAFTYISATSIEAEVPDLSVVPGDPFIATIVVRDTVTGVGALLPDAVAIVV